MPRKHALAVAALLGLAAVAGTVAAVRTTSIGVAAKPAAPQAQIEQRAKRLDAVEASLARALKNRPPALPALRPMPVSGGVAAATSRSPLAVTTPPAPAAAPAPASAAPVKIVYKRPAPIVVSAPRAGEGDDEGEHEEQEHASEATSGGEDGGYEGDDD